MASVDEINSYSRYVPNTIDLKDPRRPGRVLIALIDKCPAQLVVKISPGSEEIKNNLKICLVLMCFSCGIMNGCALTFMKVGGEILNSDEFKENIFFSLLMLLCGLSCAIIQMIFLNLSMKYYNNLDVMPIYQATILMGLMVTGLLVLKESALYTWGELFLLFGSAIVVIAGIYILTIKQNLVMVNSSQEEQNAAHGQSQIYAITDDDELTAS